jgi:hypothetical protein
MKKLLFTLSIVCALTGFSQTNIVVATTNAPVTAGWVAPIEVQTTAAGIRIRNISISIAPNNIVMVAVAWEWVNAQGTIIRNGVTRYTQAQLEAKLAAKGTSVAQFKGLFLAIAAEEAVSPANQ